MNKCKKKRRNFRNLITLQPLFLLHFCDNMNYNKWSPAIRIAGLYILFGALWIVWSDWMMTIWVTDFDMLRKASTHKGWFFVGITGIMLFFLIRNSVRQINQTRTAYSEALRESERRLSTLMANLPGMAFRCCNDKSWTMLFVSKGCETLTGYPVQALENSTLVKFARIIHPEDRRRVHDEVEEKVKTKEHYQLNYRIVTASGEVKWVWEQAVGVWDDSGNLLFIEGFIIDISAQRKAENIIREQVDKLQKANAELDRFAQSVSHDLRSPLVTIEGFLGLVREDVREGNVQGTEKKLNRIYNVIEKMHQLLEDLLKLARMGQIASPMTRFPMNEAVDEVIEQLQGIINKNQCSIQIDPAMPMVYADRSRIQVVLQNLIENAIKFRIPGSSPSILLGARDDIDWPVFFIKDNGIGIEAVHYDQVFQLFNRLDRNATGTGVGLSLVERIIRFHGGKVWVESEGKDKGSCFFFTLPKEPLVNMD
jgi:two-component system, chemotaxis family, sensor kinase Cph1